MAQPLPIRFVVGGLLAVLLLAIAGCGEKPVRSDYVARVGDQYLTESEVSESLEALNLDGTGVQARQQIIEQWVSNALLYREAQRRDLASEPAVRDLLREQERSVLVGEITTRLYQQALPEPAETDIRDYYDQNRQQLRLREPFVRLRYLSTRQPGVAQTVRDELGALQDGPDADSIWTELVQQHASEPELSLQLADAHYPKSRLFGHRPAVRSQLAALEPGTVASVFRADSLYHVLQLVERTPAGTIPPLSWVEPQIRQRLTIRARKQMYTREVQRLRNEAQAQDALDIR